MSQKPLNVIIKRLGPSVEILRDSDIATVETEQRITFPNDFKAFVQDFGSGVIDDFIYIWNPFSAVQGLNWETEMRRTLDAFREWRLYPSAGGLLPCGHTGNSDVILWDTHHNNPDDWTIAVYGGEPSLWHFPDNITVFLHNCLTLQEYCAPFGDMHNIEHMFRPLPEDPEERSGGK
jgi:hypothetical protein